MKKITLLLLLLFFMFNAFSQKKEPDYIFGSVSLQEKQMKVYQADSTANAVVLYEHGDTDFFDYDYRVFIRTKIYKKIKILNSVGKKHGDIEVILYNNDQLREELKKVQAITYSNGHRFSLKPEQIYKTKISDRLTKVSFALPEVHAGSVIEYTYTIESPFLFNLTGWDFQEYIPKVESVFKAKIPANYFYNRNLVGSIPLVVNNSDLEKDCFKITGIQGSADCELLTYSMKSIPAFVEEDFMTSEKNFMARIAFELSEYKSFNGSSTQYTTSWKSVDRDFKHDKNIGGQLKRKAFFNDVIPEVIINEKDELLKAKRTYRLIQNHYSWNEKYELFRNSNVKKAYKEGVGTVGEINISLINALDACGLNVKMGLLSTRNNGFPTKVHPVISDFNYLIAHVEINGKNYLLDATEKNIPFGILPFRCLNQDVRIMDFKNGSYWSDIIPNKKNHKRINMMMKMDEEGSLSGKMRIVNQGYDGINKREYLENLTEESYIEEFEDNNTMLYIESYKNQYLEDFEKPLTETFDLTIENSTSNSDKIYFNPFLMDRLNENPFKLKTRSYPVDFGYPRKFDFSLNLEIPDTFEIESLPKGKSMKLPENAGVFIYRIDSLNHKIRVSFSYSLYKSYFYSEDYNMLKQLFKEMILSQKEPIILKRIAID